MTRLPTLALPPFLIFIAIGTPLQGATVLTQEFRVETEVEGIVDFELSSSLDISSVQDLPYNNSSTSEIRADGSNLAFSEPQGSETFRYFGSNVGGVDANLDEEATTLGAKVLADAESLHTITFTLAPGETRQANLFVHDRLDIANGNQNSASVIWNLTTPGLAEPIAGIRTVTTTPLMPDTQGSDNADDGDSGMLSAILSEAGTYTLTVRAVIPEQEFTNANRTVDVDLQQIDFEVVNIPEPSSSSVLLLAAAGLALYRRR